MTKKLLLFISFLLQFNAYSQEPTIEWQKCFGGTGSDSFSSIKQTSDGGYIAVGSSNSNDGDLTTNKGENDVWVLKLNSNYAIEWQKTYGGSRQDFADSVQQTTDGGYIIAGYSESNDGDATFNHGSYNNGDFWVIKINALGVIQWQKSLGGIQSERSYSIIQTIDGNYVVTGHSSSNDGDVSGNHGYNVTNKSDVLVIKLDTLGNILWSKSLGGTQDDRAYSIKQTTDGGFVLCGSSLSNDGDVSINKGYDDAWIVKLSSIGSIEWQKTYGGSKSDYTKSISQTNDGGFIVVGSTKSIDGDLVNVNNLDPDDNHVWVLKLNSIGDIQWQKVYGRTSTAEGNDILQSTDGGYIFVANSYTYTDPIQYKGSNDTWIVKINDTGTLEWQKVIGGSGSDMMASIQQTTDGNYIMAGYTFSNDGDINNNHGSADGWIVKLSSKNLSLNKPKTNTLVVYPNPVTSILNFEIPNGDTIDKTVITDINGKIISEQDKNTTQINTQHLKSGMYIINAYSSNKKFTHKFIKK